MSDFAKAQLLKYGWTEGKGLGKNENGIAEALKPKLKFDTSGVGHKDTEYNWWDCVYDKALKNIVLDKQADEVSIKIAKENAFNIASSKSGLETSKKNHSLHYGKFLKTSTLQNGNLIRDSTCEVIEDDTKDNLPILKMSDEELFKACKGRTGHKGARHGLNLNGKLARIAEQEKQFLKLSSLKTNDGNLEWNEVERKKKKKRKKSVEIQNCVVLKNEHVSDNDDDECLIPPPPDTDYKRTKKTCKKVKRKIHDLVQQLNTSCKLQDTSIEDEEENSCEKKTQHLKEISKEKSKERCKKFKSKSKNKKSKRSKDPEDLNVNVNNVLDDDISMEPKTKKSKKEKINISETIKQEDKLLTDTINPDCSEPVKSRRKNKYKQDKSHRSSKVHVHKRVLSDPAWLNEKILIKKTRKYERKERKKFEKLSESLLAVSLNVNSPEESIVNVTKTSKSFKKHKKSKHK